MHLLVESIRYFRSTIKNKKMTFCFVLFSLISTFAHRMARKEHIVNALLVVLIVALLAICVRSIVHENKVQTQNKEMRDVRSQ